MKVKKGDNVIILAGKDKGKKGKILMVLRDRDRVIVEGANSLKRHQRPRQRGAKGSVVNVTHPIHVSNVSLLDPKGGKATRLGAKVVGEKKIRIARKSGMEI